MEETFALAFFHEEAMSAQNTFLEAPFSIEEVSVAVRDCGADKAPGPDGFCFDVIKGIWNIVEKDVFAFLEEFQRTVILPKGINLSFLSLIPKKLNPVGLSDFRQIFVA